MFAQAGNVGSRDMDPLGVSRLPDVVGKGGEAGGGAGEGIFFVFLVLLSFFFFVIPGVLGGVGRGNGGRMEGFFVFNFLSSLYFHAICIFFVCDSWCPVGRGRGRGRGILCFPCSCVYFFFHAFCVFV